MRRLPVYISLLLLALLFLNGSRRADEAYMLSAKTLVASMVGEDSCISVAQTYSGSSSSAAAYLEESYTWFVNPAERSETVTGRTVPVWLTGVRRALSSPVFTASDAFLNYHRAESAARSFASWRTSLCGCSGCGAISVLRSGDCYVYALRRIVV